MRPAIVHAVSAHEGKMKTLNEVIELAKSQSKDIVESGQEHIPILLAMTPASVIPVVLADMNKNKFKESMGDLLRCLCAEAYVCVHEARMTLPMEEDSPLQRQVLSGETAVSQLPPDDRAEVLIVAAAENGRSYRMLAARIDYTVEGERRLGEWREMEGDFEGRMILREW